MRLLVALGCVLALGASEPLRIVAVERQGLPPYEDDRRLYRLQGQARVSAGELLELSRPGGKEHPGRLRVVRTTPEGVLAMLDRRGDTFPLKGDVAMHWEMADLPGLPVGEAITSVALPQTTALAAPKEPRQLWEPLFFLPGDATLSPLGRAKAEAWVREFGEGRWTLECPRAKGAAARLINARVKAIRQILEAAGVRGIQIKSTAEGQGRAKEAVFLRYQEGLPPKVARAPKA